MLRQAADREMAYDQSKLDLAYQDFINQRDAERQNLQFYNQILQGLPTGADTTVTGSQYSNPLSQYLGIGLGTLGMYQAQQGG